MKSHSLHTMTTLCDTILASTIPLQVKDTIVSIVMNENISQTTRFFVLERLTARARESVFVVFQIPDEHDNHGDSFMSYTMFGDGMIFDKKGYPNAESARTDWRFLINQGKYHKTEYKRLL